MQKNWPLQEARAIVTDMCAGQLNEPDISASFIWDLCSMRKCSYNPVHLVF